MSTFWPQVQRSLDRHGKMCLVHVVETQGSTPRETGARMIIHPDATFHGTIGGGALEWQALAEAAKLLARTGPLWATRKIPLGPDLGQCCGGSVTLGFEVMDQDSTAEVVILANREEQGPFHTESRPEGGLLRRSELKLPPSALGLQGDGTLFEQFGETARPLLLYGAGHVGRALVLTLAMLPFKVMWIDPRAKAFPSHVPPNVSLYRPVDPLALLEEAANSADKPFLLVMTHDHALDLALADRALALGAFGYVGVIGSNTKAARFRSRLSAMGHSQEALHKLVCPVASGGLHSKKPAILAIGVAHELLMRDEALSRATQKDAGDERRHASSAA